MIIAQSQASLGIISPKIKQEIKTKPTVMAVSFQFLEVSIFARAKPIIQANIMVVQNFAFAFFMVVIFNDSV